jgi:hypothetical protein
MAGSIAINYAEHNVEAIVGSTGILASGGDISVLAEIDQKSRLISVSGATKPKDSGSQASVAVAIGLSIFNNSARAIIEGDAQLDAHGAIKVNSQVNYDFLIGDPYSPMNPLEFLKTTGPMGLVYVQDGTLGYASNLFNTFVMTSASQSKVSVGGSIAINVYNNTAEARIESGAQIN